MKQKIKSICILFITGTLFSSFSPAQTIVPAGLGPMSAVQPDRETAILSGNLLRTGGQNPTVKIVWGDEDGEIAGKSWDNTVVISTNQVVGSFSTTITIPNQEKIYYFRSVAENAGGTVVSRSLGVLNPSAVVGVSDLRGRWSFDDDNFSDPVSPADYSNLKLWLDAADSSTITKDGSNKVSLWNDKSGNSFNLSQSTSGSQPTYDPTNSKVTFSSDYLSATAPTLSQPLTFFTVLEYSGSDTNGQYVHDSSTGRYVFGEWNSEGWGLNQGDPSLKSTTLNPTTKSVFSYQFNGSSSAVFINGNQELSGTHPTDNLGGNYVLGAAHNGGSNAPFQGSIYEHLIISNISSQDRQNIEGYLARKWGIALSNSVNSIHAAKDSSGNNHHGILKKKFQPNNLSDIKLWLDASDTSTITHSSNAVSGWDDKSGNGFQLQSFGDPSTGTRSLDGKNVIDFDGDDYFESATGYPTGNDFSFLMVAGIDAIDHVSDSIFCIRESTAQPSFQIDAEDASAFKIRFLQTDMGTAKTFATTAKHGPSIYEFVFKDSTNLLEVFLNGSSLGTTAYTAVPNQSNKLLIFANRDTHQRPDGFVGEMIGVSTALSNTNREKLEGYLAHKWGLMSNLPNDHPYKLGHPLSTGSPSFIADTPFGDGKAIDLADGHVEISTGGNEDIFDGNGSFSVSAWVKGWPSESDESVVSKGYENLDGWSVGRGSSGPNVISVNLGGVGGSKTATHSTALSTDNQWHHIVSTYDGGTRKIYLDGTEVSSASASGSVASTTATLLLGASDMNDTAGTVTAARHSGIKLDEVRFYTSGLTSTQVSALYNFGKGDIGNIGEFTTLPAKISGTTGTALSTTVTAAFPNANYEAVNLTPGLGINSATGEISGTPTVGGVGSITVIAKNAAGKRAVTTIPYDSNPTDPAFAFPTTSPASDHAVVMGEITHSGGEENVVDLFWGDNDGNQTLSNWDSNATPLGTGKEGFYGTTISGLTAGETYHYRLRSQGKLNPKGISGSNLNLWLDAADSSTLTLYSGKVSTWSDKSGNDNHATQSNSDYQPTLNNSVLNALPVIRFDGSNDVMTLSGDHALQTFFLVLNARDGNNFGDWDWPMGGWTSSGNKKWVIFANAHNNSISGENASINGGTPSSEYINFSPLSEHKLVRVAFNAPASRSDWKIGDGDANWNGDFAEIIAYSGTLSTLQIQKIEGYLAHKWGLSLPNGHPYRITPPASQTTWSSVQSFTTPTNVTVPVLGSLSTANVKTTTADLQSTLTDNGNAATDLIFYWGDNDGGTNLSSWDSNFTVSNAQVGTLRKSLTGLTGGTTYYFRTYASNWKGNVWASTTRSFTTVTSTVRDNPVRNSDLKGWWKLDGNLKDSSGNNHHGKGDFTLSPKNFDGLKLWLDASDSSTISHNNNKVTLWKDKSGNNRHVSQSGADSIKPTLSSGSIAFNGSQYLFNDSPFMYANGSIEIFIVASGNSQSDIRFICEGSSSDNDPIYAFQTNNESPQNRLAVYFRNDTGSARRSQNAILNDVAMDGSYKILHWMDTGSSIVGRVNGGTPGIFILHQIRKYVHKSVLYRRSFTVHFRIRLHWEYQRDYYFISAVRF